MPLPVEAVRSIHDQSSFLDFLRNHLGWPIREQLSFEDLSYGWQPEEIGLKPTDLKGSTIAQLRPFTDNQP